MERNIESKINDWLTDAYDKSTRDEIIHLQHENPNELHEAFCKDLEFGTGGLRGIMGVGTNRMNKYTVGAATQGLANYLSKKFKVPNRKVAISFDSRHNSAEFAQLCAEILSANHIQAFLFKELRPTPMLSFAVRYLGCCAGIMITASHNTKEYNGYKVYWKDGGQLVPPHDKNVIAEVHKVTVDKILWTADKKYINLIGKEIDKAYLTQLQELCAEIDDSTRLRTLKIVYTPLHGTGGTIIPKALKALGFKNVFVVESQAEPDGDFPTVKSPNPENPEALKLALEKAQEVNADIVLATDPDADRVGLCARNSQGGMDILNGNQTGTLLINYLMQRHQAIHLPPNEAFVVKTIVTTDLIKGIATDFNIECLDVLTGFKYIAEAIREHEAQKTFLVGCEESYGYLVGDFVRDKDAISACCFLAMMTVFYRINGKTNHKLLPDVLNTIYRKHGMFKETLVSLELEGEAGTKRIKTIMDKLRLQAPKSICDIDVVTINYYMTQQSYNRIDHTSSIIDLPKSNVLQVIMADKTKITIRPSGTEPKIKLYFSVCQDMNVKGSIEGTKQILNDRLEKYKNNILELIDSIK